MQTGLTSTTVGQKARQSWWVSLETICAKKDNRDNGGSCDGDDFGEYNDGGDNSDDNQSNDVVGGDDDQVTVLTTVILVMIIVVMVILMMITLIIMRPV